jgi:hypothetical protein
MRYLLLGLALTAFSAQLFGQEPSQEKPDLPPPTLLNPPAAAPRSLTAPGEGPPFKNWQELLNKSAPRAEPHTVYLDADATGWAASGHCSVPLLSIPLPEHFDDKSIHKLPPHYDDKMLLPTPPVCPLHHDRAEPTKCK